MVQKRRGPIEDHDIHVIALQQLNQEAAADIYGRLRADLEAKGRRLAEPDLRIASIVLARELVLVTGNVRHFSRVPALKVENWLSRSD